MDCHRERLQKVLLTKNIRCWVTKNYNHCRQRSENRISQKKASSAPHDSQMTLNTNKSRYTLIRDPHIFQYYPEIPNLTLAFAFVVLLCIIEGFFCFPVSYYSEFYIFGGKSLKTRSSKLQKSPTFFV